MDDAEECDRIAIIDGGRIVALGTPAELESLVGGDVVELRTEDDATAAIQLHERFGLEARADGGALRVEVSDGAAIIRGSSASRPSPSSRWRPIGRASTTSS